MTRTDRDSMIAIMEAMKPEPDYKAWYEEAVDLLKAYEKEERALVLDRRDYSPGEVIQIPYGCMPTWQGPSKQEQAALEALTNLKPSNTKAQLLDGIAEARAILNGDAK